MKLLNLLTISLFSFNAIPAFGEMYKSVTLLTNYNNNNNNKNIEVLTKRDGNKVSAGSGGDPHFRTYDGTKYSFHGQCDLIMTRSQAFGSGLGLEVHARTEMVENWSMISNAAIRLGNDILEVSNDGSIYYNGVKDVEFPLLLAEQYKVTKNIEIIETAHEDGTSVNHTRAYFVVDLGNDDNVWISTYKNMVSVEVNMFMEDAEGMLGIHGKPGMIGRDRETVLQTPNEMGLQWQVTYDDKMLFNIERFPQFPETCILPSTNARRRLRRSDGLMKLAKSACAAVSVDMRMFCIDDVLATGDADLAGLYGVGF